MWTKNKIISNMSLTPSKNSRLFQDQAS
jgi:hypothetical protein